MQDASVGVGGPEQVIDLDGVEGCRAEDSVLGAVLDAEMDKVDVLAVSGVS